MNALIVSFKFHPGHISHLVASYKQMEDLGYKSSFLINKRSVGFIPPNYNYYTPEQHLGKKIDVALFLFPHPKNIMKIAKLKFQSKCKIIYFFHEPLTNLSVYKKAGFSYFKLLKLYLSNLIDAIIILLTDIVILPSQKAVSYYQTNKLYRNKHYIYIPLMYIDERTSESTRTERKYLSYIGTVASDHSFVEFLEFVKYAIKNDKLLNLNFMIATASDFYIPEELQTSARVFIKKGIPLTDKEINDCYAKSKVIWNAYNRMTQSGVLAKAFMFGTPAIMMRHNLNEFAHNGEEVAAVDDNKSFSQIEKAIETILQDFDVYSNNCRNRFMTSFFYKNYNKTMASICSE